jgi:adenylylsulfate kinase-like enzyme
MKSKIVWFTGLSGAGKTTLAKILCSRLTKLNFKVQNIDGDNFRKKNKNTNKFSKKNIIENNLSIIKHITKIQKNYDFILVSVISPLLKTRNFARIKFGKNYYEVYVKCKIKTLEQRDTKKLYEKAKKRLVKNLIGYNSKIRYEISKYKKIRINTDALNKTNSIKKIMKKIYVEKK